ncbi:MAG: InlB B-repeat-containing protein [Bacteroidales bacterium]|nr:InlB B-repeat-containing protein [Bacteroidales bacterium]
MKRLLFLLVFVSTMLLGNAQVVRIQFEQCDRTLEAAISRAVSIDGRQGCHYVAYANPQELAAFEELGIPYEIDTVTSVAPKGTIAAASSIAQMAGWNKYPNYSTYVAMMQNWATNYPNLCKLDTVGYSYNNHLLLCLKISDNPTETEAEPEFFYMSSMHGDEVTGFYFMLRLIDTLLTSYGTVEDLTQIVNNTQLYIMPDANPDGTYKGGDNYIWQPNSTSDYSGRYNGHGIDLNRTYPDPFGGAGAYGSSSYQSAYESTEIENKYMIQYMNSHHFVMAGCMHGGAEILNFPWDTYTSSQKDLADAAWWTAMGNRFLNTLRTYTGSASTRNGFPRNMYTGALSSGSTAGQCFGGDWYAISGGWQDYSNFYNHIRAFTIEVSNTKCPYVNDTTTGSGWSSTTTRGAKTYWYYQKQSLINMIKEVQEGVHGFVVDSVTREPLRAFIEVVDHDRDSSQIYSRHVLGDYYRPIADGTYSFRASCPGYITKTYTNVTATYGTPTNLLIELVPEGWTPVVYTITATSEDNAKGTVEGGGTYLGGQTATLTATANAGYEFDHWNDDNTDNPRSFTVTEDAEYTAYFSAREYILTVESEDNAKGTVAGGGSFAYGATTQISATPNEHYTFARWNDNNTQNPRTVTVTEDATYTAYFNANNYTITVTADNNTHGSVNGGGSFAYGTTTQISATPNDGYEFTGWSDGNTDNPRTVTVTGNATYTATFAILNYTITVNANNNGYGSVSGGGSYAYGTTATLTATPNEGYHFVEWNDHNTDNPRSVTVTGNATYTATFAINSYTITVQPNNASFGSTTGSGTYTHGQTVTATATANDGYVFNGWSDGATATPHTFTATQNITLIANFSEENHDPVYYTVTVVSDNNAMGTASGTGTYLENSAVTISATPTTGHHFTQWNDGNTDNPRTVTVTGNITYTAFFATESYSVTVAPDDATHGSTTPNGTSTYAYGTTINLTATAAEGYHFLRWNDGSTQATRTVTVTGSTSYIASFAANTYHITVTANNPAYGSTTGSGNYSYGEQVSISATAGEGHNFSQWSDGDTQNPRTITVTGDATYTAVFTTNSFQLTVVPDETSHGTTTGSGTYAYGEQANIIATALDGYRFREWNDGNTYPIRTVTVTGNTTYTAYFDAIAYTVTVNPNNQICGSTTGSGTYSYMQEVTATATPANGFRFDHWSDGTTDNPYVFNVTHNVTLIAVFVSDGSGEGIDDVEELNYRIYPNPTNGKVNIQTNAAGNEPMKLYNLYGQLLQTLPAGSTEVDLSGYAKGTYFLRIGTHSMKLVKM